MRGGTPEGIPSQIFAIGGGELITRETFRIDNLIVNASGRARPWTICIPAASYDSPDVCQAFGTIYGDALKCRTDYLRLIKGEPGGDDFRRKIGRNEIFYFPDGELDVLMEAMERHGVVDELRAAYARGAIFCGVGAGGAALGKIGFKGNSKPKAGLGLGQVGIGCLPEKMKLSNAEVGEKFKESFPSFVLDYMTTLHVDGDKYRLLTESPKGTARVVVRGEVTEIQSRIEFESLAHLSTLTKSTK